MGRDPRPASDDLSHLDRLAADPERFHLFAALRLIEASHADAPRLGESRRPREDPVRLGQVPEMAFARATIAAFEPPAPGRPGRLANRFFGVFGPQGPLPLHLTNYARERSRNHRDWTLVDFANLFTHRMLGLLYRAWASAEPAPSFDRPGADPFAARIAALSGYRGAAFADRDAMPDLSKRYFAGHLAGGTRHAEGLAAMVSASFGVPVRIRQFVGTWLGLEPDDRWRLGATGRLGEGCPLGDRVWSRSAKFVLKIGPLGLASYRALLPGGRAWSELRAIVRNHVGDTLDWDAVLVLRADEVPATVLGRSGALGHTSWIGQRPPGRDADDLHLAG